MTSNRIFRSSAVRAIGPTTPSSANGPREGGKWPVVGIRPGVGLSPQMPLKCAGTRIEPPPSLPTPAAERSEEHTSELQSRLHLVCRLLLEKKKKKST